MDAAEMREIRQRVEAATPGPWKWRDADDEGDLDGLWAPGKPRKRGRPRDVAVVGATGMHTEGWVLVEVADAEFIAHARSDVPALLDEVERLRDLVQAMEYEMAKQEDALRIADEMVRRQKTARMHDDHRTDQCGRLGCHDA